eukprot:1012276_1
MTTTLHSDEQTKYRKVVVDANRTDIEMAVGVQESVQHKTDEPKLSQTGFKSLVALLVIGWIVAVIFVVLYAVELGNNDASGNINCDGQSQTASSSTTSTTSTTTTLHPSLGPTVAPSITSIPKNLVVLVSDGMGQSYNQAYRTYKNQSRTVLDEYLKGRFSTTPTNPHGITDSAAGATVFSTGFQTQNAFIGVDGYGNPKGTIL